MRCLDLSFAVFSKNADAAPVTCAVVLALVATYSFGLFCGKWLWIGKARHQQEMRAGAECD